MTRGTLRIYLGAAPGVGKTFAMLGEGRRRAERGTDVVVGFVESHGRPRTAAQLGDLPVVRRRRILHDGVELEEMDLDAVLARRPQVVLVDELAHSNVPGSRHAKRWEDVEELLDAGIDVISTVNIAHLESLSDVCEAITGVPQRESVPDAVVRGADQIELVDMTPEALRRRLAHGNIYDPETIDVALANYFRIGNLIYEMHFDCDQLMARLPTCSLDLATPERMQQAVLSIDREPPGRVEPALRCSVQPLTAIAPARPSTSRPIRTPGAPLSSPAATSRPPEVIAS